MRISIRSCREYVVTYGVPSVFILIMVLSMMGSLLVPPDIESLLGDNRIHGAIIFGLLMCAASVIAPITVLPMVPIIAPILGPFTTGTSCVIGWTTGAVIAFLIARYGGRPLLQHFVNVDAVSRFEERIPMHTHFLLICALRLVVPVDVLSYALGLFSRVSIVTYTGATFLGVMWFAFALSYMADSLKKGSTVLFVIYGVASLIIVIGAFIYITHTGRQKPQ